MSGIESSLLVYLPSWLSFGCHGGGGRGKPMAETRKYPSVCGRAVLRVLERTLVRVSSKCLISSRMSLGLKAEMAASWLR
jgi:hypothetical protein